MKNNPLMKYSEELAVEIDGQIINITLKKYKEEDGEIKSGNVSFALFMSEGKIYDDVHKKIN